MSAFVDTNVLIRHLTGEPRPMATAASAFLREEPELFLADLIVADTVYVLESFYGRLVLKSRISRARFSH